MGHKTLTQKLNLVTYCLQPTAGSGSWSVVNTTGAVVKGGYGHSSVYDELNGVILVHGGYHSMSAATYLLTDALYEFNPNTSAWYVHRCSSCVYFSAEVVILCFITCGTITVRQAGSISES